MQVFVDEELLIRKKMTFF